MIKLVIFISTVVLFSAVTTTITYFAEPTYSLIYHFIMNLVCSIIVISGFIIQSRNVEAETVDNMRSDGLSEDDIKKIKEL